MTEIHDVKLEILRPGPAHNQLLSPLTPYLVLCGAEGPATLNLPFEQRQLLIRLERLRYSTSGGAIPPSQREAEVRELGEIIGKMFSQIPALLTEIGSAREGKGKMVHLRLSFSALELGLLPFEAAIAQDGFPGSGTPLFLQTNSPLTLTREVRRGRPLPVAWNRPPRILFVFASPAGLPAVPAEWHLRGLRRAIDPWVKIKDTEEEQLQEVKKILTVLPDASLEQIREACAKSEYTHVHILAHGDTYEQAGDKRYGLALCGSSNRAKKEVVDGESLVIALTTKGSSSCATCHRPTVVSLATCDSGNVASLLIPGGSIAHELHAAGIPWVFASQFPLWMRSSNIFVEELYAGLLKGDDPRCVLHHLRQRLRTACPKTHDWVSIVAYAAVPPDFAVQVGAFRDKQTRNRIETKFERIDYLLKGMGSKSPKWVTVEAEVTGLMETIRRELEEWRNEPITQSSRKELAERLGMSAASEKRIGIFYEKGDCKEKENLAAYKQSREFYRKAIEADPANHWVITQYLSMLAIIDMPAEGIEPVALVEEYGELWIAARQIGRWLLPSATGTDRAWALGTLAELELLATIYGGGKQSEEDIQEKITEHCKEIGRICDPEAFALQSTRRQFQRYAEVWKNDRWLAHAKAALTALGGQPGASVTASLPNPS